MGINFSEGEEFSRVATNPTLTPFTGIGGRGPDGKFFMEFHCPPEPAKEPGRWRYFPVTVEEGLPQPITREELDAEKANPGNYFSSGDLP